MCGFTCNFLLLYISFEILPGSTKGSNDGYTLITFYYFFQGTTAFVAQQAFILNATVRDNILFGCKYDKKKYDEIVEACALKPDFLILPKGDKSQIGEKV